ncbi:MAG: PLP-dependent aminotransferase family protein, partial [Caldilineaceae bacterium]|nr:PLP-dependent aminotransferase family protein [Caldilineaceae bacterium]
LPEQLLTTANHPAPTPNARRPPSDRPQLSQRAQAMLTSPQISPLLPASANGRPRPFSLGMSALDAFPYPIWSRLVARRARQLAIGALTYQDAAGYLPLREVIAAHVTLSRSVRCTPDQVVIVAGAQGGFDLVARLLLNPGDPVWMEDPGYVGARGALLGAGAEIVPVPIDHEGLMVEIGIARAPDARLVYVTPSHQFPLGVTMSLARRLALLEWAKQAHAYVLEDDYNSEFRFAGRPLATLQGLDRADRVIYVGTFSKVLAPALRIGYLILPPLLVEPLLNVRRLVDFHLPVLEQAVLADFMAEGHYTRHLRRMRTHFAERRAALLAALAALPLDLHAPEVGSHCVGWLPAGMEGLRLLHQAAAHGLNLWLLSRYSIEPMAREGLVIGYGDHDGEEMQAAVRKLGAVIRSLSAMD